MIVDRVQRRTVSSVSSRVDRPDAAVLPCAPTTDCVLVRSSKGSRDMDTLLRALRKPGAHPWLIRSGPLIWTLPFKPVQQYSGNESRKEWSVQAKQSCMPLSSGTELFHMIEPNFSVLIATAVPTGNQSIECGEGSRVVQHPF